MSRKLSRHEISTNLPYLPEYERNEIWGYLNAGIYYIGTNADKWQRIKTKPVFEDEEGFYKIIFRDHIKYRYEIIRVLGRGAFGEVVEAFDHKDKVMVAIKVAKLSSNGDLADELGYLQTLNRKFHDKKHLLLQIYDYFIFRNHYCLVEELLHHDLKHALVYQTEGFTKLIVKDLARSAFTGLACIHEMGLVHADIGTSNIALKTKDSREVKIIDFGCCHQLGNYRLATYMQTRYYRAPEVILRLVYGLSIDVWSMGCVVAELATGSPLFLGSNEADQLAAIIEVLGVPPREMIAASTVSYKYFLPNGQPIYYRQGGSRGPPGSRSLKTIFKGYSNRPLVNFLEMCLKWDPQKRLTPGQALQHKFFLKFPFIEEMVVAGIVAAAFVLLIYLRK